MAVVLLGSFFLAACAQTELVVHAVKKFTEPEPATTTTPETTKTIVATTEPTGEAGLSPDGVPIGDGGRFKIGDPYVVMGVRYVPKEDRRYDVTGIASWYGKEFDGLLTANGETYDMNALTAAHKTLPMPSYVRVTNLENGRSLVLRINDRGPFVNRRIIDVSRRGAQLLGFQRQGTARVRVAIIADFDGETFVSAKPFTSDVERTAALAAPIGTVESDRLAPPEGVEEAPAREVEADPAESDPNVTIQPVFDSNLFIQAGAFAQFQNANMLSARLSGFGRWWVTSVIIDGRELYRVRFGPLANLEEADTMLAQVIESGHTDARIIID